MEQKLKYNININLLTKLRLGFTDNYWKEIEDVTNYCSIRRKAGEIIISQTSGIPVMNFSNQVFTAGNANVNVG